MLQRTIFSGLFIFLCLLSCKKDDDQNPPVDTLQLNSLRIGTLNLQANQLTENASTNLPLTASFSAPLEKDKLESGFSLRKESGSDVSLNFTYQDGGKTVIATPAAPLEELTNYEVILANTISSTTGRQFQGATYRFRTDEQALVLEAAAISGQSLLQSERVREVPQDFSVLLTFSLPVSLSEIQGAATILANDGTPLNIQISDPAGNGLQFQITPTNAVDHLARYALNIDAELTAIAGNKFDGFEKLFYTAVDETPKFPVISDEELLDLVQEQTFKYFWDNAHPLSGLAREHSTSGDTVTIGGSGFGMMAILVGIERGFITREAGVQRLTKMVDFLSQTPRFHGAWNHWLNGSNGINIPFDGAKDDGGDLVQTGYLMMSMLTVLQYLDDNVNLEIELIDKINPLWESMDWEWYRRSGQDVLYWYWSVDFTWEKNVKIKGYNHALITYILAASSPTHTIPKVVYDNGWASNGTIKNGNSYYNIQLPLGPEFGGPLYYDQYSFLGLNPSSLSDGYADYNQQTVNHTLINREHCIQNPNDYVGYSAKSWGLTTSDDHEGADIVHSPAMDRGVITPSAAISSMPFTPDESMAALRHFYYTLGDKLWGEYGFTDAFNPTQGWVSDMHLADRQGPIIVMIENQRSGLLWDLFMSNPDVQNGLNKLGFTY